jgi:hypothetical protein
MKKPDAHKAWIWGGIVFAAFSSVCCTLPFIFAALGVGVGVTGLLGGVGRFAGTLIPYRPIFVLLHYAFIRTYKPVLDDIPYRSFERMSDYRHWCETALPAWLGYGRL